MNLWHEFEKVFADALQFIAKAVGFLGGHRWAAAIILLTIIVRTALLPLAIKQVRSMQAMQRLQPEMKRLQGKYKKDKQKLNQEMMELYKREGVNPLGGCLPLVAQMPVLFAMYYAIRELSADVHTMPFFGLGNLADPANSSVGGYVLLAVMTITSYLSTRQMTANQDSQQQRIARIMPLMFVFIMLRFPAGLVLYWTTQNIYQLVQQTLMLRTKTIQTNR